MDFLQKLDFMMKKYSLNKRTLSQNSGIPYTTIDGWYKKGYEGMKISTLRILANYFDTVLDFWIQDEITDSDYGKSVSSEKNLPSTAEAAPGENVSDMFDKLNDLLVSEGIIKDGDDLTDRQAEILLAICRIINAAF